MSERQISGSARAPFFASLSRLHAGALVTLRVGAHDEVVDEPFRGVSEDGGDVVIHTGDGPDAAHLAHRVNHPASVALLQTDEGADVAVEILSKDGTRTEIRFRSPIRADLLDPAVE
jgi:hypothetical protein